MRSAHQTPCVIGTSRNQMNVAMHYRLPCRAAAIDSHIEPSDVRVLTDDKLARFLQQLMARLQFGNLKVEIVCYVAPGDYEYMPHRYGIEIFDDDCKFVLQQNNCIVDRAERAT